MEELKNEEMYVLVAPDGSTQLTTLAPEYSICLAMIQLFNENGIGQPIGKLFDSGYKILPVRVTITQDGDEHKAFEKGKQEI